MKNQVFLTILLLTLLAMGSALMIPSGGDGTPDNKRMPWLTSVSDSGELTVFNLTLGKSTLKDALREFRDTGSIILYVKEDGRKVVEVYFQKVIISGIRANIVLTMQLTNEKLDEIYLRGARVSKAGSGTRKVDLISSDLLFIETQLIDHITYLPYTNLEEEVVTTRFGEPKERIAEVSGITHWLYPEKGLDIAMNPEGKEVFQYLPPNRFEEATKPLIEMREAAEAKAAEEKK
jgi:hypothetical protein